jgi:exodeoxyribonuclease III
VKIATFNINDINKRLSNLVSWLRLSKPDVVCLQELKCAQADFPEAALRKVGYSAAWVGQKTWNGVAIIANDRDIVVTRTKLPGDRGDTQSRYIEVAVSGVIIACLYAPNGNPQPGPKFDYKLAWLKRLNRHAAKLIKARIPVVLAGDFNVVPTAGDIYPTRSWDKDALVRPAARELFAKLIAQGWTDAVRTLHPHKSNYTFWSYWRNRFERDAGLRIDHLLLDPSLAQRLQRAGVDRKIRAKPGASDHAPAWIIINK